MNKSANLITSAVISLSVAIALLPGAAFAETDDSSEVSGLTAATVAAAVAPNGSAAAAQGDSDFEESSDEAEGLTLVAQFSAAVADEVEASTAASAVKADSVEARKEMAEAFEASKANKKLSYDVAHLVAIGSQTTSGHNICCPSYACAYADAVLDGTVRDHAYYTCSNCTWPDWGGGASSSRSLGSDEELLREAYDQIAAGKPTVIHVSWSGGEHWIALIGYQNVSDPDHLTLANFIALDPWDGAEIEAASKYALYGDGCEHVSDR